MTGTDPATRARPRTREELEDDLLELPDRLAKLADESDLVEVRRRLVWEVGETIRLSLMNVRTYVSKKGEPVEFEAPEFSSAMKGWELLGRWLLLDPDELIERSEKVRRAFERGRKAA